MTIYEKRYVSRYRITCPLRKPLWKLRFPKRVFISWYHMFLYSLSIYYRGNIN